MGSRTDKDVYMRTVKWTCKSCDVPNIFVYDDSKGGQHALTCKKCGGQGHFNPAREEIVFVSNPPTRIDTCSTDFYVPRGYRIGLEEY